MSNHEREVILLSNYRYPNIEAERVRLNLSQEKLVNELGIERKTYYNWLRKGNIPVCFLSKLADRFDCSVDYLLGRTRNPQPPTHD